MGISMGKWPDFEYHGGKWLKYDQSGFNSSHQSLGSPLDLGNPWRPLATCLKMAIWGEIGYFHLFWDWDTLIHRDYQEETIATWCQGSKSDITRVMINDSTLVQQIAVDKLQIVPCADFTLHSNCQLLCMASLQPLKLTISSAVRYSLVPTYILPPTPLPDFSSLNVGGMAHWTVLVLLVDL